MIALHRVRSLEECREIRVTDERYWPVFLEREESNAPSDVLDRRKWLRATAITRAYLALLLDADENAAREAFALAAEFALRMIRTKEPPPPMKITELQPEYSPDTGKEYLVPIERMATLGGARMSFADFSHAFFTLWSFGSDEALREAAMVPQAQYSSPGLEVPDWGHRFMNGEKALARGALSEGISEMLSVLDFVSPAQRAIALGAKAAVRSDSAQFQAHLIAGLKLNKKQAAKKPGALEGMIWHSGMMLCRLALRHGVRVPDQNYLPLRFAPWYST